MELISQFRTYLFIAALGSGFINTSCTRTDFSAETSTNLSSTTPPNNTDLTTLATQTVLYPLFAQIKNAPSLYEQTQILINTQMDHSTCEITAFTSPMETGLCNDVPDLCWNTKVATVTKSTDFTCSQSYRALDILSSRNDESCAAQTQVLTSAELMELNNPQIYSIKSEVILSAESQMALGSLLTNLNTDVSTLNTVNLDSSCRCYYGSVNANFVDYKYPALEKHCHSHFQDVY